LRGRGFLNFFSGKDKTRKKRKAKKEEDRRVDHHQKLRLAAAAQHKLEVTQNQERRSTHEELVDIAVFNRARWKYFMTTPEYKTFIFEAWKVNQGKREPTYDEIMLFNDLKLYDPNGYRAVQQRTPPAQQGGKRRRRKRR